ncbi:putative aldouronate transport system substrate-binding protein [Paenibacillus sp. UNCCL117]|uniref:extracellular solute-binding protein n=1 Tax=unclassified Paenibacillus TaxID=185978 RepID=UPI00088E9748|nr:MULTISPECIES: extracellular solute-binding protein [unclassified Paenibacillus]SDD51086.1 putative aldouronate transport system substrate-binding protein [Paenibacillus sp. cl123]SFW49597.1 putative aldouronate transport system substrate-binding protein [Paenibacillus sp. UNCCL117]
MKKLLAIGLTMTVAGSLVACTSNQQTETGASQSPSPAPAGAANEDSKKFTISTIGGTWAPPVSADGGGLKSINEKFNIDLKPQFVPYAEYSSKLPVVIAGGDLPDVIGWENVDASFMKWVKQGAFLPLNDYINDYPTLKAVPKNVWDAVTYNGKIYAIPNYAPAKYGKKTVIRKDWLDNLGLKMPTNYEELKKVAIAFTRDDPDKNGKNDTYGFGLSQDITYGAHMGAYWDSGWYHKNEQGQLIPGTISEGFKEQTQFLADLYKEGAIHKDWAVSKVLDVRKDFYAGKFGIWYEQVTGLDEGAFDTLLKQSPGAKLEVIPAFKQPDGQQGFLMQSGFYTVTMLNAKLKNEPDKVKRILGFLDYFRTFIPVDERNPQHADFDWINGGVNKGYKMVNNTVVPEPFPASDIRPTRYTQIAGWAPSDEATEPWKLYTNPLARSYTQATVEHLKTTKFYVNPINRISSEQLMSKGSELNQITRAWQTKMIVGQEPISSWDKMVDEFMKKGGKEVIDEVNKRMKETGTTGEWK